MFSGSCFHLLVVSTHSTGQSFLCREASGVFSLVVTGWTVVGGFGRHSLCMVNGPLYLTPWDKHRCAFALIETINKWIKKK